MNYRKRFVVEPGAKVRLDKIDPAFKDKHDNRRTSATPEIQKHVERLAKAQYLLYADGNQSLLVVLQALDAGGKDGVVRHVFSAMNPQGTLVSSFKQPSKIEAAHDFLWRAHLHTPAKGQVVIFNRSHYEDVLVVRVHKMVPKSVWSKRYDLINDFEKMLHDNGTRILKFYLHISPEEQLERFAQRLDDPMRHWKISEGDYSERKLWPDYMKAYEDAMERTSTKHAPWYVIPSDHKWFRNLAISEILADTMEDMDLKLPPAQVDIAEIRGKYHAAAARQAREATSRRRHRARSKHASTQRAVNVTHEKPQDGSPRLMVQPLPVDAFFGFAVSTKLRSNRIGQLACCTTLSATLPMRTCASLVRPCVEMMIKLASTFFAASTIAW